MDNDPVLEGVVYLDEKLVEVNHVGTKQNNKEKPKKRGISDQKRNMYDFALTIITIVRNHIITSK